MYAQVVTLFILAVFTAYTAAVDTDCLITLNDCTSTFENAEYNNWFALKAYRGCVEEVDCPDDTYATDQQTSLLEDIDSRELNWGRNWNVKGAAPQTSLSMISLVLPVFAVLTFAYF